MRLAASPTSLPSPLTTERRLKWKTHLARHVEDGHARRAMLRLAVEAGQRHRQRNPRVLIARLDAHLPATFVNRTTRFVQPSAATDELHSQPVT